MFIKTGLLGSLALAWFLASHLPQIPARSFQPIDFPGAVETGTVSITSNGQIAGQYVNPDGSVHGYLLKDGQFTSIDFPGAATTQLAWMNDRGDMVGGYNSGNGNHGFSDQVPSPWLFSAIHARNQTMEGSD
jgi:hypothetical protein